MAIYCNITFAPPGLLLELPSDVSAARMAAMCSIAAAAELGRWITSSGGFVGPIAVETRGAYRGLFCTSDGVPAGEPLLAVPRSCTLRGEAGAGRRPIERLVHALLEARDKPGEFGTYLETLPSTVPLLRDWSGTDKLARLDSPAVAAESASQHEWLKRLCDAQAHSRESVEWAERLCRSRGIACVGAHGTPALQLVPLLDLANHRAHGPDVAPALVEYEDGVTVLCACTDLARGDEVTFQYTDDGNRRLLLDYGFAQLGDDEYVGLSELDERLVAAPEETAELLWRW